MLNKIRAYRLQDAGVDTVEANHRLGFAADLRDYAIGAAVLGGLGVRSVRLMTNNPHKVQALEGLGVSVAERVPLLAGWNQHKRPGLGISSDKSGRLTEWRQQAAICPYTGKTGHSLGDCAAASRWVAAYRKRCAPHLSAVKRLTDVHARPQPKTLLVRQVALAAQRR